jgi:Tol biopolymer transport system component
MLEPRASADGKHVAFVWNRGNGRPGVYALNLADSSLDTLQSGLMNPLRWSRDGRSVFLSGGGFLAESDRVLEVRADGSHPAVVGVFPRAMEVVDVTPDGRQALFIHHERRSDAWVIQFPGGAAR